MHIHTTLRYIKLIHRSKTLCWRRKKYVSTHFLGCNKCSWNGLAKAWKSGKGFRNGFTWPFIGESLIHNDIQIYMFMYIYMYVYIYICICIYIYVYNLSYHGVLPTMTMSSYSAGWSWHPAATFGTTLLRDGREPVAGQRKSQVGSEQLRVTPKMGHIDFW